MEEALTLHRLHFAFTITFHYLFPQLTMGLGLLIVILKTRALQTGDRVYDESARFWTKSKETSRQERSRQSGGSGFPWVSRSWC